MGWFKTSRKWQALAGFLTFAVLAAAAVVWFQGSAIVGWYYVRNLARAGDASEREAWQGRVHRLGRAGLPPLLAGLRQADPRACTNLGQALREFPDSEVSPEELANALAESFPQFSGPGQQAALETLLDCVRRQANTSDALLPAVARLVTAAAQTTDGQVHAGALKLAEAVAGDKEAKQLREPCRELVRACFRDDDVSIRILAVRLSQRPSLDLLEQVVPQLQDPNPEVRLAALLALGPAPEVLATDDLLQWLHDPDPAVRQLCETALRGRGLPDLHIQLGRFLTDAQPANRLQVLDLLRRAADLEPGVWIRRLSHDRAAAVRAAAVRAAAEQPFVDLSDRLEQMAQDDPSPTVRQLARYYLKSPKRP
jgi:hypothetical protein